MARMVPELSESQILNLGDKSRAEVKFYLACKEQLGSEILVIHSIKWISTALSSRPRNGETDFTIFDPNGGFIVVEVKGGGVGFDRNSDTWYSIGKSGRSNLEESPFAQAMREEKATLAQIRKFPDWNKLGIGFLHAGYGVFFPDLDNVAEIFELPDVEPQIVGKKQDLLDLKKWIKGVADFWKGNNNSSSRLGTVGMNFLESKYCKLREVKPLISARLDNEEVIRIQLTEEQTNRLRLLGRRKRAAICGGAGTGKTLLAIEKARQLAGEGLDTLLLCYNKLLGDQLANSLNGLNKITAMSFHKFCYERIIETKSQTGKDLLIEAQKDNPGEDLFNVIYPYALWLSNDDYPNAKFDAIIIDEGQDFLPDFWDPIEDLLKDENESHLYIFYDSNQMIFQKSTKFPIKDEPYPLTKNCRNTLEIHNASYRYYKGEIVDPPFENEGLPIISISANSIPNQSQKILKHISDLLCQEKVGAENISILIADNIFKTTYYSELQKIENLLPKGINWAIETVGNRRSITVETVQRYKGLEANIVFLWGIDSLDPERDREIIYVALSRAKDILYLVGNEKSSARILSREP